MKLLLYIIKSSQLYSNLNSIQNRKGQINRIRNFYYNDTVYLTALNRKLLIKIKQFMSLTFIRDDDISQKEWLDRLEQIYTKHVNCYKSTYEISSGHIHPHFYHSIYEGCPIVLHGIHQRCHSGDLQEKIFSQSNSLRLVPNNQGNGVTNSNEKMIYYSFEPEKIDLRQMFLHLFIFSIAPSTLFSFLFEFLLLIIQ